MLDPSHDDAAYELLRALRQAQSAGFVERGALECSDAWLTRLAEFLAAGQPRVQGLAITTAGGVIRLRAGIQTPFGAIEVSAGLAPSVVRIDPRMRRIELQIVEPPAVAGGGMLGGLMGLLGTPQELAAKALAGVAGVELDGDRLTADLTQIARAESLCTREWLGRPLCHYVQVIGCTVGEGGVVAHWRTGLDPEPDGEVAGAGPQN